MRTVRSPNRLLLRRCGRGATGPSCTQRCAMKMSQLRCEALAHPVRRHEPAGQSAPLLAIHPHRKHIYSNLAGVARLKWRTGLESAVSALVVSFVLSVLLLLLMLRPPPPLSQPLLVNDMTAGVKSSDKIFASAIFDQKQLPFQPVATKLTHKCPRRGA